MSPLQLIGPSYNLESRPASVQRTVNLMPVPLEPGNERTGWVFKDVPGLSEVPLRRLPLLGYAWWDFEENDALLRFIDSSPYLNDLTTTYASSAQSVAGGVNGTRAHFRGGVGAAYVDRKIYIPRANTLFDFGSGQSFSFGCFIEPKASMADDWTHIFLGRAGIRSISASPADPVDISHSGYWLGVLNGSLDLNLQHSAVSATRIFGPAIAANNVKQMVVGVCDLDAGLLKLAVNGVVTHTSAIASGSQGSGSDANFTVGHSMRGDGSTDTIYDPTYRQANAYIDKAFVVPRALTSAEVTFLYNAGAGRTYAEALAQGIMV
jgi:hypothetical protein